jgi:hypothetical protein
MYRNSVVTFIDILGFRDIVMSDTPESVQRKLRAIQRYAVPELSGENFGDDFEPVTVQFSDSIVRIRPIDTESNQAYPIGLVFHELLDIVHAQAELTREGVLLRGGVAFGNMHFEDSILYGPALIKAYDLESKFALHPRIVVEPELIAECKSNRLLRSKNNTLEQEFGYVESLLRQSDDGIWFVDYARAVESELDDPSMYIEFLEEHRDLIIACASRHQGFGSVAAKYMWLAKYHNNCVEDLSDAWFEHYDVEKSDLLLTSSHIAVLQEMLP